MSNRESGHSDHVLAGFAFVARDTDAVAVRPSQVRATADFFATACRRRELRSAKEKLGCFDSVLVGPGAQQEFAQVPAVLEAAARARRLEQLTSARYLIGGVWKAGA